jgi:hypothetical protein
MKIYFQASGFGATIHFVLMRSATKCIYIPAAATANDLPGGIMTFFLQAGIYMLPSHLSPGARDLIPCMLLVDPTKRITIPEIQQHACF